MRVALNDTFLSKGKHGGPRSEKTGSFRIFVTLSTISHLLPDSRGSLNGRFSVLRWKTLITILGNVFQLVKGKKSDQIKIRIIMKFQ